MSDADTGCETNGGATCRRLTRWLPTWSWMLLIFIGSMRPGEGGPSTEGGIDKIEHLLAYAILAVLAYRSLLTRGDGRRFADYAWRVGLFGSLYGLGMELCQIAVPGRDFQSSDVAANCLGIALALVILLCWYNNRRSDSSDSGGEPAAPPH